MNAIDTLKEELVKIRLAMMECIDEIGYVKNGYKYRFQLLFEQERSILNAIKFIEEIQNPFFAQKQ